MPIRGVAIRVLAEYRPVPTHLCHTIDVQSYRRLDQLDGQWEAGLGAVIGGHLMAVFR